MSIQRYLSLAVIAAVFSLTSACGGGGGGAPSTGTLKLAMTDAPARPGRREII